MKEQYILYGAGEQAKVIADMMENLGYCLAFAIDKKPVDTLLLEKYPVHLSEKSKGIDQTKKYLIGIGNNGIRKKIAEEELYEAHFGTIIDRTAIISKYAKVGEGTVIMPGATINVDTRIGKHCIINTNASVDHDCKIKDYVHISPNASLAGNVSVGECTHIGIGAIIIQGIKIGCGCTIGAGAVIIRDVPDGATVVGNPGRIIKNKII